MKTAKEYKDSLKALNPEIYFMGRKIEDVVEDPATKPHVNAVAELYQMANEPEYEELFSVISPFIGKKINRFTHIHQSREDLIDKVKCLRAAGQRTATCFQRCAGWDGMHTMYILTYEIDEKYGTSYHKRFLEFLKYMQEEDLVVAAAVTDPKGDRSLPPSKQADPDMFLHVVEKNEKGIVVRGAKAHLTGGVNSHEVLAMPTSAMREEDKNYAIAFAVPIDTKGIYQIFGRQTNDGRKEDGSTFDQGNIKYGVVGGEALMIFDDVFVPWERVFMFGEYDMTGRGIEIFACTHRQNYGACKVGVMDCLIGATSLLTEYQGTNGASHIKDKLVDMTQLNETLFGTSLSAGILSSPTSSGAYFVNPLLANVTKKNVTQNLYEICRISHDISGGILATLPSEIDYNNPELGKYIDKYLKGKSSVPTRNRMKILRLIEAMTGGTALVEAMHGAGSPQAQKIMMLRNANLKAKEELAKKICDIED